MDVCRGSGTETFSASSLRLTDKKTEEKMKRKKKLTSEEYHFTSVPVTNYEKADEIAKVIREHIYEHIYERLKSALDEEYSVSVECAVAKTTLRIMENRCRMEQQEIRNEAELRFCIGDPLLCSICDTWHYRAKLEESVKDQTMQPMDTEDSDEPDAANVNDEPEAITEGSELVTPCGSKFKYRVITKQSRADYTVHVVRDPNTETIIFIVIEAKHTSHSQIKHVAAQLIGYFAAFNITVHMPLVFVLTEEYIQMLLFPFINLGGFKLINAVFIFLKIMEKSTKQY